MEDSAADNNHNIHSDDDHDEDDDCVDEPSVIRPIEEESVRRIVAGQAVTDLASCVKELVDNALDAGSKSINIRLFNQGLDIVEVSDDGSGVPMDSRPFLATAHATSKIRAFEDIYTQALSTLGFRGEALFCLANLSEKLVVATRTEREPIAQRLEYKHDGSLDTSTVDIVPRKVGTTVAVLKLLNSLPVRRADMERRIAQHRAKMMKLMEAYAIFSVGVRINLMDMVDRKEKTLLATAANTTTLEQTMSSILGSKFLASVTPISIDLTPALDPAAAAANADNGGDWKLEGYISKAPGNGKGGGKLAGQQYFSINGRPVELPKVARIIGDVWRTLGGKNKPSCVLTLILPNQEYDVNLSPEKRQVLLTHEDPICQRIQTSITELWASQTDGQFVPSASQPADATASASSANSTTRNGADSKLPPKVDNIESLLSLQESNRKRALEKHSKIPTAPARENSNDMDDEMDVGSQYGESNDSEEGGDEHAGRRAYMRRFREEQKQQHSLNASPGDVDCQYGEEVPKVPEQQPLNEPSPRVRRRGGFVHDISTAKQWERPASIGRNFEIPEGVEDPSDSEDEAEQKGSPEKRQRTDQPPTRTETSPVETTEKLPPKDVDVALDTPEAAIGEVCSSRRVTLQLNNELADSGAAASSSTESLAAANLEYDSATGQGDKSQDSTLATSASVTNAEKETSDGDKLLWVNAQARFNQCGETSPEKEIDVLLKTSVSPKQKFHTPHVKRVIPPAKATNSAPALNLEQFAFRQGDASERVDRPSRQSTQPAVSPDEEAKNSECAESQSQDTVSPKANEQSPKSCGTDEVRSRCKAPRRKIVWGSFNGTESAVAKTKQELQRVDDRKHKLKQVRDDEEYFGKKNKVQKKVSLAKGDFAEMSIIGQFNLGFILAKDRQNHLWILDQHACDERFNFERLMASTVVHEQKLIAPMPLELDPSEESCVLDNMEIFNKNGFRFLYDENKPPRHRLALTALPHSGARDGRKAVNFGKEDVSALCAILGADNGSALGDDCMEAGAGVGGGTGTDGMGMYGNNAVRRFGSLSQAMSQVEEADKILARLPKAIAMFASRACRSSIMIGTSLSKKSMETIVKRLDALNFPFKCAHGRPTMTHVVDLQRTLLDDERKEAELVSGATISMSLSQPDDDGI